MTVNDIYKGTGSGFCVSGQIETGALLVNDKVLVQPQNELATVKGMPHCSYFVLAMFFFSVSWSRVIPVRQMAQLYEYKANFPLILFT